MGEIEKHTITALVEDRPGVLTKVAGLIRRRGFNIASLAVGHSEIPDLSRMTFVVQGDDYVVEQVTKQLYKLIDVVRVSDISNESIVSRELALVKVSITARSRANIVEIAESFHADIVDVDHHVSIVEVVGDEDKVDAIIDQLRPFGLMEVMRTGRISMVRGSAPTGGQSGHSLISRRSAPDSEVIP